jgi:hypothetical protein
MFTVDEWRMKRIGRRMSYAEGRMEIRRVEGRIKVDLVDGVQEGRIKG